MISSVSHRFEHESRRYGHSYSVPRTLVAKKYKREQFQASQRDGITILKPCVSIL